MRQRDQIQKFPVRPANSVQEPVSTVLAVVTAERVHTIRSFDHLVWKGLAGQAFERAKAYKHDIPSVMEVSRTGAAARESQV